MKNILTINTANCGGGAEKVAYSLCKELFLRDFNSKMLVGRVEYSTDPLVHDLVFPVPGWDIIYSAGNLLDQIFSTHYLFYLPTWKIPLMKITRHADVIHMHNMHGYYFNLLTIPFLMRQKPVVWTFHDMWPFTGKCAHAFECDRYTRSCGCCPYLLDHPKLPRDTTRFHLSLKKVLYGKRPFHIISPSEWLRSHIEKSFLKNHPVTVIPSPVNTKVFYPEEKQIARERLSIPQHKKVLLFVAGWIKSAPNKGVKFLKETLHTLYNHREDLFTLVVGRLENQTVLGKQYAGIETGWIEDLNLMRACYAAADIFISPTTAENSSCTIAEAMACGTVPVAFAVGGVPEQIVQKETGILVQLNDTHNLIGVINYLLDHEQERNRMAQASTIRAQNNFSMNLIVEKYLRVYQEAINFWEREK